MSSNLYSRGLTEMASDDKYRMCARCIMDTTDPDVQFDDQGVCNHCNRYDQLLTRLPPVAERPDFLNRLFDRIKKQGAGRSYDCVVGLSGGVDSSYLAYLAKQAGLRPLTVHVDAGWNSELAVKNIEGIVKTLDLDLHTVVVDWDEMRDLQAAFMKAEVPNQDIPQDHAFTAAVLQAAAEHRIQYILGGSNVATESIMPRAWGYNALDLRHLKAIHRRFGRRPLKQYPKIGFFDFYVRYPRINRIQTVRPLNYVDYNKAAAMATLQEKLGWRYYGGKHYESRFTKFFQACYLPRKFGYDKRKAHLSSLIVSGQMSREDGLAELNAPLYEDTQLREDKEFVSKKLGIGMDELEDILNRPGKPHSLYPSSEALFRFKEMAVQRKWINSRW